MFLLDVYSKGITGKVAEEALEQASITVNKNTIPFDEHPPLVTSGIRVGTPALTTRGMKEGEMEKIGKWIAEVLSDVENDSVKEKVRSRVADLAEEFPLYAKRLEKTDD